MLRKSAPLAVLLTLLPAGIWAREETAIGPASDKTHITLPDLSDKVAQHHAILPAGSIVPLLTRDVLSSKTHRKGDIVTLEVAQDVLAENRVVIAQGSPVVAQISEAEEKGLMGRPGKLSARVLYLDLPDGPVRLSGELATQGKSNTGTATAATALVSGFAFIISGKSAVIPAGTELVAVLDRDVRLNP